jgi:uracil-DNA glycosylase family protein
MRAIDADAVAIRRGAMAEHDAAKSHARRSGEMPRFAAVVVDDRPHKRLPELQRLCDGANPTDEHLLCTRKMNARAPAYEASGQAATVDFMTSRYPQPSSIVSLRAVAAAAKRCRACDLWQSGTQTVFGEGPRDARLLLIGEQPGDAEDKLDEPFVGPAGRLLDEALAAAGIDRKTVYLTNAVKHFKWRPKGKRRIHEKPDRSEIRACQHWLELELRLVKPELVVALGATAAQALLGPAFRVTVERGKLRASPLAARVVATVHPSTILRAPDEDARRTEMAAFVRDLKTAKRLLR